MEPLAKYRLFQSAELECAREMVAQKYCAHRLDFVAPRSRLDAVHNHVAAPGFSFNYMRYGGAVHINPGELEKFYLIQIPLAGGAHITNGKVEIESTIEFASILNPDLKTNMVWHADCEMLLVQIEAEHLRKEAEAMLGRSLDAPIRFDPKLRMRAKQLAPWRQQLRTIFADLDAGLAPHGLSELLMQFLEAAPSNIQCFFDAAPVNLAPAQIKRAMAYIKSEFSADISLHHIARAAGASVRALQYGFKQAYGITPMQMVRLERLRWAHYLLQGARPNQTVTQIASDLGFSHLGRFSQDYRDAFGETPQQTLNFAKHQLT